jgi:superfamily II DNA or RNA helicase
MSELPELFDHQKEFLDDVGNQKFPQRALLFYKTGAGKSLTAMLGMQKLGYTKILVIAPPSTHLQWVTVGKLLDMTVEVMSHAKFRMKDTKLSRTQAIIADEFHLFGGQKGQGWKKLDTLARHLLAPLFMLSATPNYNDAERCYCIQHVLDPLSCRGGYLQFIYYNCTTEQNPFGMEPKVTGFLKYANAAEYLAALPNVYYLPDDLVYTIQDIPYKEYTDWTLTEYMYNRQQHKMVASIIELAHTVRYQGLVAENGYLHPEVLAEVLKVLSQSGTVLIYANHATIAEALARSLDHEGLKYAVVTGVTPKLKKAAIIQEFLTGQHNILIGTATLATGTDGMDRVCNTLLILDDTDDDALRRQLVGRIMPRGDYVSSAAKQVFRLTPTP